MSKGRDGYEFAGTEAAHLLAQGISRLSRSGISQRELARRLGYKQSVILSHMASGRTPIPVERVLQLADAIEIDAEVFMRAVLKQRFPKVSWDLFLDQEVSDVRKKLAFVRRLETIAAVPIDKIPPSQIRVMREVAGEPNAGRRWLSVHELGVVEAMRELRPKMAWEGLTDADEQRIYNALST